MPDENSIEPVLPDELKEKFTKGMTSLAENFLLEAMELGTVEEIDKALKSDPKLKSEYDKFTKERGSNDADVMQFFLDTVISMQYDPDIAQNSIENYKFPYYRTHPKTLRRAGNSIPAQLIKTYRKMQLSEFSKVSDGKKPGFRIITEDPDRKLSEAEQKKITECARFLSNDFFFCPMEPKANLSKFMRFLYADFFDLDKVTIEVNRTKFSFNKKRGFTGIPTSWHIVDPAPIHQIAPEGNPHQSKDQDTMMGSDSRWGITPLKAKQAGDGERRILANWFRDGFRYLQEYQDKLTALYTPERLVFARFDGTTALEDQFRGHSIVEKSINILRYAVDSITYNQTRRSANRMPKGMISIHGGTDDAFTRQEMAIFRKLIWGLSTGKSQHWKYPVIGLPKDSKISFTKFYESAKEMEDFLWMSTLWTWLCYFAGVDPEALGMSSNKNSVGKQRMFNKQQEEGAEVKSQDSGLRSFLSFTEDIFNSTNFITDLTGIEGLLWEWCGLDVEDESKKQELIGKELQGSLTMNELRAREDKETFDGEEYEISGINIFDMPGTGNPQFVSLLNQLFQEKRMEQYQEEENQLEEGGNFPGSTSDRPIDTGGSNKDYLSGERDKGNTNDIFSISKNRKSDKAKDKTEKIDKGFVIINIDEDEL